MAAPSRGSDVVLMRLTDALAQSLAGAGAQLSCSLISVMPWAPAWIWESLPRAGASPSWPPSVPTLQSSEVGLWHPLLPLSPPEPRQPRASEREDQSVPSSWLRQEVLFIQPPTAAHDHSLRSGPGPGWQLERQAGGPGPGSQGWEQGATWAWGCFSQSRLHVHRKGWCEMVEVKQFTGHVPSGQ